MRNLVLSTALACLAAGFMAAPLGLGLSPTGNMTMADGAPLSVGSRAAAFAVPAPSAVRHAAPARAIAASRSSDVPFLMCLSFCIQTLPQTRRLATGSSGPADPCGGQTRRYCNGIAGRKTRQGGVNLGMASHAWKNKVIGKIFIKFVPPIKTKSKP